MSTGYIENDLAQQRVHFFPWFSNWSLNNTLNPLTLEHSIITQFTEVINSLVSL